MTKSNRVAVLNHFIQQRAINFIGFYFWVICNRAEIELMFYQSFEAASPFEWSWHRNRCRKPPTGSIGFEKEISQLSLIAKWNKQNCFAKSLFGGDEFAWSWRHARAFSSECHECRASKVELSFIMPRKSFRSDAQPSATQQIYENAEIAHTRASHCKS